MAARVDGQDAFVQGQRILAPPQVLLQVGEIEQRRHECRVQRQRGMQLGGRRFVSTQAIGIDDAPVEVRFLRLRDAAVECLLVRSEGRFKAARFALQDREVEPRVGQVGPACEQSLVGGFGFVQATRALQSQRFLAHRLRINVNRHVPASVAAW